MDDKIQKFVQDILAKAGLEKMPTEFKKEYSVKLGAELERRLGIMAVDNMDEAAIKKFEDFSAQSKSPQPKELMEFFSTNIPDFEAKVTQTLDQFATEFIGGADKLRKEKA